MKSKNARPALFEMETTRNNFIHMYFRLLKWIPMQSGDFWILLKFFLFSSMWVSIPGAVWNWRNVNRTKQSQLCIWIRTGKSRYSRVYHVSRKGWDYAENKFPEKYTIICCVLFGEFGVKDSTVLLVIREKRDPFSVDHLVWDTTHSLWIIDVIFTGLETKIVVNTSCGNRVRE